MSSRETMKSRRKDKETCANVTEQRDCRSCACSWQAKQVVPNAVADATYSAFDGVGKTELMGQAKQQFANIF